MTHQAQPWNSQIRENYEKKIIVGLTVWRGNPCWRREAQVSSESDCGWFSCRTEKSNTPNFKYCTTQVEILCGRVWFLNYIKLCGHRLFLAPNCENWGVNFTPWVCCHINNTKARITMYTYNKIHLTYTSLQIRVLKISALKDAGHYW